MNLYEVDYEIDFHFTKVLVAWGLFQIIDAIEHPKNVITRFKKFEIEISYIYELEIKSEN